VNVPSESPAAQVAHGAALAQAGRHGEAADIFRSVLARGGAPDLDALLGLAASLAALGEFASAREAFSIALELRPGSRDVQLRLYEIEQILGNCEAALDHLQAALDQNPLISTPARRRPARTTLLALSRAGMFEANTPYEFVVDPETVTLHRWYLRDDEHDVPDLTHLPEFDLLVNAIAESDAAKPALRAASRVFATYTGPKLNAPDAVATMDREGVAALFRDSALVNAPPIARRSRAALLAAPPAFPFLIRPIGSQAGVDLAKIDDAAQIAAYLAERPDRDEFYVTDFVDYRGADGFFRKYRVIFVAGEPFAYHAALSPNWMIHYYNAPMAENAWMREEEARFIDDISTVFAGPLMDGLREIAARFGVEYFGIDCSIAPDGRVLLFEADSAMLVHGTDDPVMYGYKIRGFERVRDALAALIDRKLGRA
jgi:hypothetical protein